MMRMHIDLRNQNVLLFRVTSRLHCEFLSKVGPGMHTGVGCKQLTFIVHGVSQKYKNRPILSENMHKWLISTLHKFLLSFPQFLSVGAAILCEVVQCTCNFSVFY